MVVQWQLKNTEDEDGDKDSYESVREELVKQLDVDFRRISLWLKSDQQLNG